MFRLALRNVWRHKVRTGVTLAAIAFGVAGLILSGGFVHDMFRKLAEVIIHSQTGHLQVAKAGFFAAGSRSPDKYVVDGAAAVLDVIASATQVSGVMGRAHFSGLLNNGRTDLSIIGEGIEPGKEARLGTELVIAEGRMLSDSDRYSILLGKGVADALRLRIGDPATVIVSTAEGAMNTLELEVVGVFQSFSRDYDARAVKIPLKAAQELLDTIGVNLLVVSLQQTTDTAAAVAVLRDRLKAQQVDVKAWNELNDFYDKTVELYDRQFGVLRLIILFMVLLSVANSVNMSLFERQAEFGTMRALGNRSRAVIILVMAETVLLGVVGSAIGVLVGIVLALAISAVGIPMPPPPNSELGYTAQVAIVPAVVLGAFLVGVVATTLGGVFPALRVARIPVVEALRQGS